MNLTTVSSCPSHPIAPLLHQRSSLRRSPTASSSGVASLSASDASWHCPQELRPDTLLERRDEFDRPNPEALISFPPNLETVPCKPLLFDIARNAIQYPDIKSRAQAVKRGGGWGSWLTGRG